MSDYDRGWGGDFCIHGALVYGERSEPRSHERGLKKHSFEYCIDTRSVAL